MPAHLAALPRSRPLPNAIAIMLVAAAMLYCAMLGRIATGTTSGAGSDSFLLLFAALWIDLTLLCAVSDLVAPMPRWVPMLSIVLLPLAGAAIFPAVAMGSLALAVPVLLPPLIALASAWPWLQRWHGVLPAPPAVGLCWAAVTALSLAALLNAP
jgi:hypothetical protein